MIIGIGIDSIEIERVSKACEQSSFMKKVYTKEELDYLLLRKYNSETMAGIFAAKEAVSKALGTGIGEISWTDICVLHNEKGAPYVKLSGNAKVVFDLFGGSEIFISITHTKDIATAMSIIETN